MPHFGTESKRILAMAHPDLQRLFNAVIETFDCKILCSFRGKEEQDAAVAAGNSKAPWPTSKHNHQPSLAIDVMPYPVDWSDGLEAIERTDYFAGYVMGMAAAMGIKVRWGHDWNQDDVPDTKGLVDRPHYELV